MARAKADIASTVLAYAILPFLFAGVGLLIAAVVPFFILPVLGSLSTAVVRAIGLQLAKPDLLDGISRKSSGVRGRKSTTEHPEGSYEGPLKEVVQPRKQSHVVDYSQASDLQKHVAFFDFDKDGIIYPIDTFVGFRKIGFNYVVSFLAPFVIHSAFSWSAGGFPDIRFPIFIENMHRTKHGSDSEVYTAEGNINKENLEAILAKYDPQGRGGLTWEDIKCMIVDNMNANDFFGWTAELLEWWAFHVIAKDENGFVTKEKMFAQYDGTLWAMLAKEREGKFVSRP